MSEWQRKPNDSRRHNDTPPRYEQWCKAERWTLLQAVCLLLDVEPSHGFHENGQRCESMLGLLISENWYGERIPSHRPRIGGLTEDWDRDVVAQARYIRDLVEVSQELKFDNRSLDDQRLWQVEPEDFLIWAIDRGLCSEDDLRARFKPIFDGVPSLAELEAENRKLRDKLAELERSDAPLRAGERKTLEKLGAYFARKFQFDPNADRNAATGQLMKALAQKGIPIDKDAARGLMAKGAQRYPEDEDTKTK